MASRAAWGPPPPQNGDVRQEWRDSYRALSEAPRDQLATGDLERLAVAAYMIGEDLDAVAGWDEAHRRHLEAGQRAEAARCAFWAALCLMMQGRMAHAGGWLSRAEGIIGADLDCAASGYLLIPALLGALESDDASGAHDLALQATEIAERCDDADLAALAALGRGQALLALGRAAEGLARLDEVMLSVTAGEVGPIAAGIVYCAVILECMQLFDLARAAEWTAALDGWCQAQPDLVPYRGQCLVHQSQLQQAAGAWPEAAATVAAARDRLTDPPHPALGLACYQVGELQRLRGELDAAAESYRRASNAGFQPMPGLALLELARGETRSAVASIRRALGEAGQPFQRPALLAAAVEIHAAAGDVATARDGADELGRLASGTRSEVLGAMAEHAIGTVLLATGDATDALVRLRAASTVWKRLQMPYEAARAAVLLAQGCLAMDDRSCAQLELDAARETFASLGAQPDLARLDELAAGRTGGAESTAGGLSARELEVLRHVAAGETNPEIADALTISRHTVGRHLENIFTKLGVAGRAAATAYAYEHDLL